MPPQNSNRSLAEPTTPGAPFSESPSGAHPGGGYRSSRSSLDDYLKDDRSLRIVEPVTGSEVPEGAETRISEAARPASRPNSDSVIRNDSPLGSLEHSVSGCSDTPELDTSPPPGTNRLQQGTASRSGDGFRTSRPSSDTSALLGMTRPPRRAGDPVVPGSSSPSIRNPTMSPSYPSVESDVHAPPDESTDPDGEQVEDTVSNLNLSTEEPRSRTKWTFGIKRKVPIRQGINRHDYEQKYPPDELYEEMSDNARVWRVYLDEAEVYDADMIEAWKDTIDVLLVFAGLFSAVVTTFVVQTSQALQPDYTLVTATLLTELVGLQRAAALGQPIDSVPHSAMNVTTLFTAAATDRWINGLWFTSLSLSLITALLSVLVKQWLQHYVSAISGIARVQVHVRQFRFDGLEKWHVRAIISLLPVLMHISLLIFFCGLVIFLSPLDMAIPWVITGVSGLAYLTYMITNVLPLAYPDCPYRSPLTYYINVFMTFGRHYVMIYVISNLKLWLAQSVISKVVWPVVLWDVPQNLQVMGQSHTVKLELYSLRSQELDMIRKYSYSLDLASTLWLSNATSNPTVIQITHQAFSAVNIKDLLNANMQQSVQYDEIYQALSIEINEINNIMESQNYNTDLTIVTRLSRAVIKLILFQPPEAETYSNVANAFSQLKEMGKKMESPELVLLGHCGLMIHAKHLVERISCTGTLKKIIQTQIASINQTFIPHDYVVIYMLCWIYGIMKNSLYVRSYALQNNLPPITIDISDLSLHFELTIHELNSINWQFSNYVGQISLASIFCLAHCHKHQLLEYTMLDNTDMSLYVKCYTMNIDKDDLFYMFLWTIEYIWDKDYDNEQTVYTIVSSYNFLIDHHQKDVIKWYSKNNITLEHTIKQLFEAICKNYDYKRQISQNTFISALQLWKFFQLQWPKLSYLTTEIFDTPETNFAYDIFISNLLELCQSNQSCELLEYAIQCLNIYLHINPDNCNRFVHLDGLSFLRQIEEDHLVWPLSKTLQQTVKSLFRCAEFTIQKSNNQLILQDMYTEIQSYILQTKNIKWSWHILAMCWRDQIIEGSYFEEFQLLKIYSFSNDDAAWQQILKELCYHANEARANRHKWPWKGTYLERGFLHDLEVLKELRSRLDIQIDTDNEKIFGLYNEASKQYE